MWLFVGMTVLLSRAVMANLSDESAYYLAETNDDRPLDGVEKARYKKSELENSDAPSSSETEDGQADNRVDDESINKRGAKQSLNKENLRDKSSGQRQAPAPLATLLYWPEREDEVVGMELRRNPLMQERRNPAFSPWGGKRDMQQRYKTITKIRRPVRVPFNSWGGKRDGEKVVPSSDLKKSKFVNWSGKRNPTFNSWGGKRTPSFNSWGGKKMTDDFIPSTNYYHHQRRRKSTDTVGQQVINDFNSPDPNCNDSYEEEEEMITEMTTSDSKIDRSSSAFPLQAWGEKKRRNLEGETDGSRSDSLSIILRKIGGLIPSNG